MATVPADAARPTTTELHTAALQAARDTFDPREIRLSAAGGCPRKQTLRILGYPADDPDTQQLSIFHAGHYWEDYIASLWEAQYPGQVARQVPVETKYGTGHIDIWVEPIRHLVESKTTRLARRDELPLDEHVDQVTLYLHFFDRGATAELAYIIKETGEILTFPVVYDPARIPRLLAALNAITVAVTVDEEPLAVPYDYQPHRFPCAWFTAGGHLKQCEFWAHCWENSPSATETDTDGTVAAPSGWGDVIADYIRIRDEAKALKDALKPLETQKKEYEQFFAQWLDQHDAHRLRTPDGLLQRTVAKPSVSWDMDQAIADGVVTPEQVLPYQRLGTPRVTWNWKARPQSSR